MTIPTANKNNNKSKYTLYYMTSTQLDLIIPWEDQNGSVKLYDRIDLLPYYIDDGDAGRTIPTTNGNSTYKKITYRSFREARCKSNGTIKPEKPISLDCTGMTIDTPGALILVNPRKLRPF